MSIKILQRFLLGIKRNKLKFIGEIFLIYSALWTLTESVSYFFPQIEIKGFISYIILVATATIIASLRAYQPNSTIINIGHSNTTITVLFGDIFERNGFLAIPANEFFDSEIGNKVSVNSLHGMVINKYFGGHGASFDQLIEKELSSISSRDITRIDGESRKYPIGTTALIETSTHKFLLFALSTTDIKTFKASSTIPKMIQALEGLCNKARTVLGGSKIIIPLVGSGLSGIGLPPHQLLQIIILVLVNETKKNQFASDIEIVIHPDRFSEIDLALVDKMWR